MGDTRVMALVLAAGILASTAASLMAPDGLGFAVVAPLIMAVALFVAVGAGPGTSGEKRSARRQGMILAGAMLVASLILAFSSPAKLALFMPVLGVAVAAPVLTAARRRC